MKSPARVRLSRRFLGSGAAAALLAALAGAPVRPQATAPSGGGPTAALAETLTAACRQDQAAFASHLTAQNGAAFRGLPQSQSVVLLKRLSLLDRPGHVLLSSSADGRTVVRCETGGTVSEMRLGAAETRENLSFVPAEVPQTGAASEATHSVRFGLVREGGQWKLFSVGLLLLDVPMMAQEWVEADLRAGEVEAVAALRKIADALETYRSAYGSLPEALGQLGPAPKEGLSPENAGLLDDDLAAGESGGYRFRYVIVTPAGGSGDSSDGGKAAGFALAATPIEYGKAGRRSFYLDSAGVLRGGDKHGDVATSTDPRIDDLRP